MLKNGAVQEAGRTSAVFSSPTSSYARKLHGDVPALNPSRYATLRDPGFDRLGDKGKTKISVNGVTKRFSVDGKILTAVDNISFSWPPARPTR